MGSKTTAMKRLSAGVTEGIIFSCCRSRIIRVGFGHFTDLQLQRVRGDKITTESSGNEEKSGNEGSVVLILD